ncbi:MAG: hypothetical protein A2V66_04600 [Ignavibacteria bacterium RBG_13_36_8]|nr:MAG: hypothetical protein A2V66_04600 [Ignavibacteria bacterium RBG_13_36_8]
MRGMKRRDFIRMGSMLAVSATAVHALPYNGNIRKSVSASNKSIDFVYDGLHIDPQEYTKILMKLADEGKIKPDYYSNGGIVEELEEKLANWLGKESAVFFPTGTLANHVALRQLAGENKRVIVQAESHIYNDSGDCAQTLSGLNLIPLGKSRAGFTLNDVKEIVEFTESGRVKTKVGVIAIESPVRRQNDCSFGFDEMRRIYEYARAQEIKLHLDGARLFAEAAHLGKQPAEYGKLFDTVYTSFYKCFNAASGAVLAGTKEFTENLFHVRRMFGGGLPNVWPFAAVALQYVDSYIDEYKSALQVAEKFFSLIEKHPSFKVEKFENGTHIVKLIVNVSDLNKYREKLLARNINIMRPQEGLLLKINPSLNKVTGEELTGIFIDSL